MAHYRMHANMYAEDAQASLVTAGLESQALPGMQLHHIVQLLYCYMSIGIVSRHVASPFMHGLYEVNSQCSGIEVAKTYCGPWQPADRAPAEDVCSSTGSCAAWGLFTVKYAKAGTH